MTEKRRYTHIESLGNEYPVGFLLLSFKLETVQREYRGNSSIVLVALPFFSIIRKSCERKMEDEVAVLAYVA